MTRYMKFQKESDTYFKLQCPCEIENDSFHLTPDVEILWLYSEHVDSVGKNLTSRGKRKIIKNLSKYKHKIYQLMLSSVVFQSD